VRIAYVTESFPPEINGISLLADRVLRHLRARGHEVQLLRPRRRSEPALDSGDEWRSRGGSIPLHPDLRFGWARVAELRRRWRRTAPDLVHVATPGPLAWSALRAAREENIATSADFRPSFHAAAGQPGALGRMSPLLLGYLKRLHSMADCTFVPKPELAQQLATLGFANLQLAGREVDADLFAPSRRDPALRQQWRAGAGEPVLLHVGYLAAEKNVQLALRVYEQLRLAQPTLRMVVVGDGPLRRHLEFDHREVVFAGMLQGAELARVYASADVFLFPSLGDGFGSATLEALASGLAVVAYDTGTAARHVRDGESGCLAPAGNSDAFVAAAQRALPHADPASALRQAARETAMRVDGAAQLRAFEMDLRTVVAHRLRLGAQVAALPG